MNKRDNITLNSFNCRGLRDKQKRINIFTWLKRHHNGITLLQETHSALSDEVDWSREWGGKIIFSHGSTNSRGVAILIPESFKLSLEVTLTFKDNSGRILMLECNIENNKFVIINVHAPTKGKLDMQLEFFANLKNLIDEHCDKAMIIGGDFNTYLNTRLDKKGGKPERKTVFSEYIDSMCEEFSSVDIWRVRNNDKQVFTRREMTKAGLIQSRLDYWLISLR